MSEIDQLIEDHEAAEDSSRFTVEELVNEIAHGGSGSSGQVIVHYRDGATRQGRTVWMTELANHGPAVVFDDPEKPGSYAGVLPLGGQTSFIHKGHPVRLPYDEIAQECWFEILPKTKTEAEGDKNT